MHGKRGFRFVQTKGLAPIGPNKGQNKDNFDKYSKIFFSWTTDRNALVFSMDHPLGDEFQICTKKSL